MRHTLEKDSTMIGLFVLAVVVIIFFTSPEDIFLTVSIVDTDLHHKTPNEVQVITHFNFYDTAALKELPMTAGNWSGVGSPSEEQRAMKAYKTDTVLLRRYSNGSRNVHFVLIESENESILHRPEVCYRLAGKFNITEKGIETIKPLNWSGDALHVNKFFAEKINRNEVVMYWYMWGAGRERSIKNSVIVMISTPILYNEPNESYALNTLKDFGSEIVPVMYKPKVRSDIIGKYLIDKFGIFGIIMEVLIIGLAFVLIFYNSLFKKFKKE